MFRKKFVLRAGAVTAGAAGGWLIHWLRACSGAT